LHARLRDQAPKIGHIDKAALQSPISVMSVAQTKYLSDGVLIYFVYPQAHEGDAKRAVLAGLELVEAVAALKGSCVFTDPCRRCDWLVVVGEGSEIRG
jgi:hypothetical protein